MGWRVPRGWQDYRRLARVGKGLDDREAFPKVLVAKLKLERQGECHQQTDLRVCSLDTRGRVGAGSVGPCGRAAGMENRRGLCGGGVSWGRQGAKLSPPLPAPHPHVLLPEVSKGPSLRCRACQAAGGQAEAGESSVSRAAAPRRQHLRPVSQM